MSGHMEEVKAIKTNALAACARYALFTSRAAAVGSNIELIDEALGEAFLFYRVDLQEGKIEYGILRKMRAAELQRLYSLTGSDYINVEQVRRNNPFGKRLPDVTANKYTYSMHRGQVALVIYEYAE